MDVSQYLEIFIDETREYLQSLNEQLLILEESPDNQDTINEIFRAAHTIKGMAGTMGFKRMQKLTHDMENVFSEVRNEKMSVTSELVDTLFKGLDALQGYLDSIVETGSEGEDDNQDIIDGLAKILAEGLSKGVVKKEIAPEKEAMEAKEEAKGTDAAEDAAKEDEKPDAEADNAESKQTKSKIKLNETEMETYVAAKADGRNVFNVTVKIRETCILKSARAYLVLKNLEENGYVIRTEPSSQDIEDEKFDFEFSALIATEANAEKIKKVAMKVAEIQDAIVEEFVAEGAEGESKEQEAGKEAQSGEAPSDNKDSGEKAAEQKSTEASSKKSAEVKSDKKDSEANKATGNKASVGKAAANQANAGGQSAPKAQKKPVVNRSVRVDIDKLDDLMNLVSELIIAKNGIVSTNATKNKEIGEINNSFTEQIEYLERITTSLHKSVMKTRMVPIESVVSRFPRMIRDLNKSLGKKMDLHITGEDTELDRTVIDEIGDPIMHLLRNSADHGIESAAERKRAGKPETGQIHLDAYQQGNNVIISVSDDGAGIDVDKVREKAISRGTITPEQAEAMTNKEIVDLLFLPSFSTAEKVTEISGRGVGLDVVRTKINSLGGTIETKSEKGKGSTFIIRLPLTLAIIQALMVQVEEEKYAIPLGSIQTIENIPVTDIKYVQSKEVINLRGNVIPLIRLRSVLDLPEAVDNERLMVVIVKKADNLAGLVIDKLLGQLEIVIKSIGKYIDSPKMISGATILGDGEIALILDVNMII
jgi:two-component system chemotaxis sensor kinase CheA